MLKMACRFGAFCELCAFPCKAPRASNKKRIGKRRRNIAPPKGAGELILACLAACGAKDAGSVLCAQVHGLEILRQRHAQLKRRFDLRFERSRSLWFPVSKIRLPWRRGKPGEPTQQFALACVRGKLPQIN